MVTTRSETFQEATVPLDGTGFVDCVFRACVLVYGGGESPTFDNCTFEQCTWEFRDAAERTAELIRAFAQAMGAQGKDWLESLFLQPADT